MLVFSLEICRTGVRKHALHLFGDMRYTCCPVGRDSLAAEGLQSAAEERDFLVEPDAGSGGLGAGGEQRRGV